MVGPLTILKMLHCRNITTGKTSRSSSKSSKQMEKASGARNLNVIRNDFNVNEPVENNKLCRVCLQDGKVAIFADNTTEDLPGALNTIGGIEVSIDDSYPKYLCQACHALLQGAILFRKTAQQSDKQLKKPIEKEPESEMYYSDFAEDTDNKAYNEIKEQKPKVQKFLTCKRCDIQFNSYQEYSDHRLSDEHENKKIVCPVCNNTYTPEYFKRHMAHHKTETLYICDVCGKGFAQQSQLTRHRLTHFYSLPFKCTLCPYKGRFSESLKMHMRSHTGEKPYQCEQCPQRFISKSNLNKHALTHKGEHDFSCEACGRGFYTKRDLEMHFKAVHAGIKEHICPICDKAFGYRKQMMKHQLKVHKREKFRSGRTPIYIQVERMNQQENSITIET